MQPFVVKVTPKKETVKRGGFSANLNYATKLIVEEKRHKDDPTKRFGIGLSDDMNKAKEQFMRTHELYKRRQNQRELDQVIFSLPPDVLEKLSVDEGCAVLREITETTMEQVLPNRQAYCLVHIEKEKEHSVHHIHIHALTSRFDVSTDPNESGKRAHNISPQEINELRSIAEQKMLAILARDFAERGFGEIDDVNKKITSKEKRKVDKKLGAFGVKSANETLAEKGRLTNQERKVAMDNLPKEQKKAITKECTSFTTEIKNPMINHLQESIDWINKEQKYSAFKRDKKFLKEQYFARVNSHGIEVKEYENGMNKEEDGSSTYSSFVYQDMKHLQENGKPYPIKAQQLGGKFTPLGIDRMIWRMQRDSLKQLMKFNNVKTEKDLKKFAKEQNIKLSPVEDNRGREIYQLQTEQGDKFQFREFKVTHTSNKVQQTISNVVTPIAKGAERATKALGNVIDKPTPKQTFIPSNDNSKVKAAEKTVEFTKSNSSSLAKQAEHALNNWANCEDESQKDILWAEYIKIKDKADEAELVEIQAKENLKKEEMERKHEEEIQHGREVLGTVNQFSLGLGTGKRR